MKIGKEFKNMYGKTALLIEYYIYVKTGHNRIVTSVSSYEDQHRQINTNILSS